MVVGDAAEVESVARVDTHLIRGGGQVGAEWLEGRVGRGGGVGGAGCVGCGLFGWAGQSGMVGAGGVRFAGGGGGASNTAASHMSLLTGLDPFGHGIRAASANDERVRVLSPRSPVLAEILRDAGYQTLGLADNGNVMTAMGFGRGFDVFENVRTGLEDAGSDWENIVDVTVFLTDMQAHFASFNRIYGEYFQGNRPTRTTIEVGCLPTPIAIELKVIATVD